MTYILRLPHPSALYIKLGYFFALQLCTLFLFTPYPALANTHTRPIVLELYTSQGCSSCPPAEALLEQLNKEGVLALSFHVNYWDYIGWKDPFASKENTDRQKAYAQILKDRIYTPQMIVDGASSLVGSDKEGITNAMNFASNSMPTIPLSLKADGNTLKISIPSAAKNAGVTIPIIATVWAMQYRKNTTTDVLAGENKGHKLRGLHNVIRITQLGTWQRTATTYQLPIENIGDDGIAILLQGESYGRIVGAATYND